MAFEDTMWDLKKSDRVFLVAILRHVIFPGMGGKTIMEQAGSGTEGGRAEERHSGGAGLNAR